MKGNRGIRLWQINQEDNTLPPVLSTKETMTRGMVTAPNMWNSFHAKLPVRER